MKTSHCNFSSIAFDRTIGFQIKEAAIINRPSHLSPTSQRSNNRSVTLEYNWPIINAEYGARHLSTIPPSTNENEALDSTRTGWLLSSFQKLFRLDSCQSKATARDVMGEIRLSTLVNSHASFTLKGSNCPIKQRSKISNASSQHSDRVLLSSAKQQTAKKT